MLLSLVAVIASLFSLLIVSLCAFGVIPPNRVIGVRTNTTLQSRKTWNTVHRRALVPLAVTTVAVAGCWLLYPAGIVESSASAGFGLTVLVAGLLWAWTRGVHGIQHPANHAG
ncbi:SdpI family protein [Cryobacterium sp. Y11]|uniref:SdpI family protein n=1 Tax=Cryobacterium sp. Y11 TaxID=2045016 RepID=UPI000CE4FBD7